MPYYQDNHIRIFNKDCRSMDELPDESVQMVCTSPPYWGLRKYSGDQELIWGGDNHCEHQWGIKSKTVRHSKIWASSSPIENRPPEKQLSVSQGNFCSLCGAWRGSLGLEPTSELYLEHLIEIMREIKRVLRKDGVFFLNLGDSYAGSGSPGGDFRDGKGGDEYLRPYNRKGGSLKPKDLCLIPQRLMIAAQEDGFWVRSIIIWSKPNPMPESVTDRPTESHEYILMLTKSGTAQYWTHRDGHGTRRRPRADYRWINQLTNEEVAIEPAGWKEKIPCFDCNGSGKEIAVLWGDYEVEIGKCPKCGGKGKVQLWKRINLWRGHDYYWDQEAVREPYSPTERWGGDTYRGAVKQALYGEDAGLDRERSCFPSTGRNIRSVWEVPTFGYPKAHFAVFPEKLPELCIRAATPEVGCCSKCGAPWTRVVKKGFTDHDGATGTAYPEGSSAKRLALLRQAARARGAEYQNINETLGWQPTCKCNVVTEQMKRAGCDSSGGYEGKDQKEYGGAKAQSPSETKRRILKSMREPETTLGWGRTCDCKAARVPSIVLDPFLGAGTTLWVAKILGRRGVGYELSGAYCALSLERNRQQVMELTPRG